MSPILNMQPNAPTRKRLMRAFAWLAICLAWGAMPGASAASETQSAPARIVLPDLPTAPEQETQPGVAGAFVGTHQGALIVAGGANFPDAPPWRGGSKVWHDQIYVLEEQPDGRAEWVVKPQNRLPRPLAYGMSVTLDDGVLIMGGCDAARCYAETYLLRWQPETDSIEITPRPAMPRPLAFGAAGRVGETVLVAGGQETMENASATRDMFAFRLGGAGWKELEPWPGAPRVLPVAAVQNNGSADCFYLFSGRTIAPGQRTELLTDAYAYDPAAGSWKTLEPVRTGPASDPVCVMGAPALATGAFNILVFGGARGDLLQELEALGSRIDGAGNDTLKETLEAQRTRMLENHPGFSHEILSFNAVTEAWANIGTLAGPAPVTTTAVSWNDRIVIPSGEVRPGIRTAGVSQWHDRTQPDFGLVNFTVLAVYLLVLVCMGFYFSRRENTTDDFFKAGGRIPWWAAGISIFGTQLSAITFIAIPAKTFATDWRYFMANMTIVMAAPIIVLLFLPFYRRLNVTTAYEYLEKRFNPASRLLGSLMFILLQFGRIGIVLFIPSMVLSVVTGMDVRLCILLMGGLSILYTVLGGIEAVIWTDVVQVAVLMGGALLAVGIMLADLGGGLPGAIRSALDAGKLHTFDFRFDFTTPTFWTVVLGGMATNMISYGSDQAVIQRYLTTSDEKQAARGIWANAILCIPASALFFFVGTALFLFYRTHPAAINPTLQPADAIFPWFIVSQLPAGIAGLVIAGVFAASMSSLDSSMNSVAAAVTTDWAPRLRAGMNDRSAMAVARWSTVAIGLAGTGFALMMVSWNVQSIWDQFSQVIGLFAGGLAGLFLLGMLTRRANGAGAVSGLLAGGLLQYVVKAHTDVHLLLYSLTGLVSCFGVGYAVSVFTGGTKRNLAGLTVYTRTRQ